ncbi:WcaF family extracellular polysaccharide biosynthesis acetyltransferase [Schleiferiaceae bacterium]|nr:WcaF family extracellular polysaccharide biosynthesis acetyltransferase [Schleiferiaceae bacterium]
MKKTNLASYNNSWYSPGNNLKRALWYLVNIVFFKSAFNPFSASKIVLLRLFGSKVGRGVVIKPGVNIKYPWKLEIGSYSWIGENVWIDNLENVRIGSNVCISQGAMLLTGNHNYKASTFDLITQSITVEYGVWIGAKSVVCPGVTCKSHSILTVGSVATKDLSEFTINQGNPAKVVRKRLIDN